MLVLLKSHGPNSSVGVDTRTERSFIESKPSILQKGGFLIQDFVNQL